MELRGLDIGSILQEISEASFLEDVIISCLLRRYAMSTAKQYASRYRDDVKEMLKNISKLMGVLTKAQLNLDWMTAALCLAIQDVSVQRTAASLKIPLKVGAHYKNTPMLLDEIERMAKKAGLETTDLKIAKIYSEDYRNEVIHRGKAIQSQKALEIMQATSNLLEALSKLSQRN